jgi:tetratricopeptide (TPR) repeat protein
MIHLKAAKVIIIKKKKKIAFILGLVLGLMSCTNTKYFVKSETELSRIDMEQTSLNYIPLTDNDLKNSNILDTTYKLIIWKKYSKLKKYLSSVQSETPDFYLAKTLYFISISEYEEAVTNLKLIDENYYVTVKDLLFIDLNYEIAKLNSLKDYKKFLQDYQTLIDRHPDNKFLKQIVALRIRYVRYNY